MGVVSGIRYICLFKMVNDSRDVIGPSSESHPPLCDLHSAGGALRPDEDPPSSAAAPEGLISRLHLNASSLRQLNSDLSMVL